MSLVQDLTGAALSGAPPPCRDCMWWQTRPARRPPDRAGWIARTEETFGAWGKLYVDGERTVGLIQYGPADRFARTAIMPAGPPGRDAAVVTCAYLADGSSPWALQSLFLAAIGDVRDRGLPALETFGYVYAPGEPFARRFMTHRTIFPRDFLADLGFRTVRSAGRVELMRLELRGLVPAEEEAGALERLRARLAALAPAPAPAAPAP